MTPCNFRQILIMRAVVSTVGQVHHLTLAYKLKFSDGVDQTGTVIVAHRYSNSKISSHPGL